MVFFMGRIGVGIWRIIAEIRLAPASERGRVLRSGKLRQPGMWCRQAMSSRSTSGYRSATLMSVFAAPEGSRRPCSQSCKVRTETPIRDANVDCDKPAAVRAEAIFGTTGWCVRARISDFISRAEARSSSPKAMRSGAFLTRDLFLAIFKLFLNFAKDVGDVPIG
jgi:hypothetical protein